MKKVVTILAAALMIGSVAMAQDDKQQNGQRRQRMDKTEMVKHRTDEMVKKLGLNDEQAKHLQELNTKYADQMGPGRDGRRGPRPGGGRRGGAGQGQNAQTDGQTGATQQAQRGGNRPELTEEQKAEFEARRKQAEEARKAYDTELQKILTADQFKAYQEDAQRRGPRGPRPQRNNNE